MWLLYITIACLNFWLPVLPLLKSLLCGFVNTTVPAPDSSYDAFDETSDTVDDVDEVSFSPSSAVVVPLLDAASAFASSNTSSKV